MDNGDIVLGRCIMLKLYFKKKSFKTMIAILTTILCFSSFNIQAKQNSNTLNSLPQGSYQLARAVFLPNANDDVWLSHYSSIPFHYQRNENCEKFGFTLPSCPPHGKCLSCPIDPKYKKLITCLTDGDQKYKISDSGTYCEAYCDVETCDTSKYFSYSCPEGTVCESCTAVTSKCAKTPWYKPTTNCLSGYHYDSGRCVKDCQVIGCGGGTGMDRTFQDKCPTGYICTSLSNEYQTSDCKKGKCFKYKSCDTANGYAQQGSPGYCEYQECYKTQTSCAAYSLNTCPENGNCSECTVQYADCSEGDKKYKLDSCKAGYQMINNSYCAKTCSAKTCDTTEYFMTTCPENMDCESCTSVTTSCEESQRFKLGPCKSGYHADSLGRCVSDCEKISCGDLWGINRTFQDKCPTGYICTTLSNEYQTSDCQRGKCFKYKSCDTENGYAQLGSPGECTYQDCYQSQTTCSGYTLDSCPQYGHCTECTVQYADCSTGATKYRLDSCDMGYSIENGQCVKSCTENSCKGYTLSSCPANADCEQCLVVDSNCSSQGTKYKFLSCQMGFYLEGGKCLPNCTESNCYGYNLKSCPDKGYCSQCQTQTTDCTKGEIKFKLDSCESGYTAQNGQCVQTCTKETCTGYTLASCPLNANCNECTITDTDCSTSGTKYQFVSCKPDFHEVNGKCEKDCTKETCTGYTLSSCPENANCNECTITDTDCSTSGTKYQFVSCKSGFHEVNGKCEPNCTQETCFGYNLTSCPEKGNCSQCQTQTTDCTKGEIKFKLDSCEDDYVPQNGKCVQTCTKETCTGYTLASCPEHANCNECTITDTDCSTSGTKYQFVSCKSGYHEVNSKCELNCTEETCFGYNLKSCPLNAECSECTLQTTECTLGGDKNKRYKFSRCKPGFHLEGEECKKDCSEETCAGYNLKSCPLNAECSECTLQTTECTLGGDKNKRYKFSRCKPDFHLEGEECKKDCSEETCAGYDLKSCPLNADCSECKLQSTNCTSKGTRYKYNGCNPGFHEDNGECKPDCPEETCAGYDLKSCPLNADCSVCTLQNSECTLGDDKDKKYKFNGCNLGFHYDSNECVPDCTETCPAFPLYSCPDYGNCSECTVKNSDCTDKETKYSLDSCQAGYHVKSNKCEKDCIVGSFGSSGEVISPIFDSREECESVEGVNYCGPRSFYISTSCDTKQKYFISSCKTGYHKIDKVSSMSGNTYRTLKCEKDCVPNSFGGTVFAASSLYNSRAECTAVEGVSGCITRVVDITTDCERASRYWIYSCKTGYTKKEEVINGETHVSCVKNCTPNIQDAYKEGFIITSESAIQNAKYESKEVIINESCGTDTYYKITGCNTGYHPVNGYRQSYYYGIVMCEKDCTGTRTAPSGYRYSSGYFNSQSPMHSIKTQKLTAPNCETTTVYAISSCKIGSVQYTGHCCDKSIEQIGNSYYCCQTSQSSSFTDYRNGKYCRPGTLGNNSSETSAKQIWNETLSKTSREEY